MIDFIAALALFKRGSMRQSWLINIAIALLSGNASADVYCDDVLPQQRFERAGVVVLAKVTESTFPANGVAMAKDQLLAVLETGTATMVVTKSWKGPYIPGAVIKAGPPSGFRSGVWNPYPVQVGDEVLIFAYLPGPAYPEDGTRPNPNKHDPLWLDYCSVTDVAHSSDRLAFLNSLVRPKSSSP